MSQTRTYQIQCPKCRHDLTVDLYDAVNVQEQPGLRDLLLRNRLNQVICDHCEFDFRVDKPLLYHNPSKQVMIYWFPGIRVDSDETRNAFTQVVQQMIHLLPDDIPAPEVHLVTERTELVERIFVLESGLDPRIIEYIKHTIYVKNPAKLPPGRKNLLFNAEDSSDERLLFVIQDQETKQLEGLLEYSRDAYRGLCEMFDDDDNTPALLELFPGPYISARALLVDEEVKQRSKG